MYVFIYVCLYVRMYVYINVKIHTRVLARKHVYLQKHTHPFRPTYTRICIHAHTQNQIITY